MKKLVYASAILLASIGSICAWAMRTQDSVSIKDQVEYQAYMNAVSQSDLKVRAAELEKFLKAYPDTVARKTVLEQLVDLYRDTDVAKELETDRLLLQMEPANFKALYFAVLIEKSQGTDTGNAPELDDAAKLARTGLTALKPAGIADAEWKSLTDTAYPVFHSAIARDDAMSKHDFKAAIDEFHSALNLYPPDATKSGPGLADTYYFAKAFTQAETKDPVKAIWFYARAWNFASGKYKDIIGSDLENAYKTYHGDLDGLDQVKAQAASAVLPPDNFTVKPAPTLADQLHAIILKTEDPKTFSLSDMETILAQAYKEDAERVWAAFQNQTTLVPGRVILATASTMKVSVTVGGKTARDTKTTDMLISLRQPMSCGDAAAPTTDLKQVEGFLMANAGKDDADKLAALFKDTAPIRKIVLDPAASEVRLRFRTKPEAQRLPTSSSG